MSWVFFRVKTDSRASNFGLAFLCCYVQLSNDITQKLISIEVIKDGRRQGCVYYASLFDLSLSSRCQWFKTEVLCVFDDEPSPQLA